MPPRRSPATRSNALPQNRLGIFVRSPVVGQVKTRLTPAVTPAEARDLYLAMLADLAARLRDSKHRPTVFLGGARTSELDSVLDPKWPVVAQADGSLGDRLTAAFAELFRNRGDRAVIIGSDSPDLPLPYLKRAFQALKHRDVVIGPAMDGGYYLIGVRVPAPSLFAGIEWGSPTVLDRTLDAIERGRVSLALLPPWYDVDDAASLRFFAALNRARRVAKQHPLRHSERVLAAVTKR